MVKVFKMFLTVVRRLGSTTLLRRKIAAIATPRHGRWVLYPCSQAKSGNPVGPELWQWDGQKGQWVWNGYATIGVALANNTGSEIRMPKARGALIACLVVGLGQVESSHRTQSRANGVLDRTMEWK